MFQILVSLCLVAAVAGQVMTTGSVNIYGGSSSLSCDNLENVDVNGVVLGTCATDLSFEIFGGSTSCPIGSVSCNSFIVNNCTSGTAMTEYSVTGYSDSACANK